MRSLENSIVDIIDGDSLCYITYHVFKNDGASDMVDHLQARLDEYMRDVLLNTNATHYVGFVGSKNPTFRHKLAVTKPYKGNRKSDPESEKWWAYLSEHLVQHWNFIRVDGIEAEDAVSIVNEELSNKDEFPSLNLIICHVDKDLNQIPGNHYNYKTRQSSYISVEEAFFNLHYQMIIGDSTDNVPGLPGKGEKYAERLLLDSSGKKKLPFDLTTSVMYAYQTYGGDKWEELYNEQFKLISLLKQYDSLKYSVSEVKPELMY